MGVEGVKGVSVLLGVSVFRNRRYYYLDIHRNMEVQ